MLDRIATRLWFEIATLPAVVNDDGEVCRITSKCRDKLEAALRPWTALEQQAKERDIAQQWYDVFGDPNASNQLMDALKKQQMIIAGLADPEK